MAPMTHLLFGWAVAQSADEKRDRLWITMAGLAPDADGVGLIIDFFTKNNPSPTNYWGAWHHVLGHNLGWCLLFLVIASIWTNNKLKAGLLILLSFHIHLVCDLIGGRGPASPDHPDGYQWPMPYFYPVSDSWQLEWSGQWALNAWPNFVCTGVLLIMTFYWAIKRGYSPLEMISSKVDAGFVATLQQRFAKETKQ